MIKTNVPFTISRVFNAPKDLVWKALTEPERMKQWWGPKGFTVRISKNDLRPGGTYHYCLVSPGDEEMWGKFVYREILPMDRLVFLNFFSDAKGGITRHPMSPTWPLQLLSTFSLSENRGQTTLAVEWTTHHASEEEQKTFDAGHGSMKQGWTGTLDQLTDYLSQAEL